MSENSCHYFPENMKSTSLDHCNAVLKRLCIIPSFLALEQCFSAKLDITCVFLLQDLPVFVEHVQAVFSL